MNIETLEVGAVILAAIAVAIFAIRLAWGVIEELWDERKPREEPALEVTPEELAVLQRQINDGRAARVDAINKLGMVHGFYAGEALATTPRRAWEWPEGGEHRLATRSVEPVRQSFRSMLEGGPDYRG